MLCKYSLISSLSHDDGQTVATGNSQAAAASSQPSLLCRDDETSSLTLITSRVCFYLDRTLLGNQRIGRIGTIDNGTGIKQILSIPIPVKKIISTNIQVKVNEVVLATVCFLLARHS